MESFRSSLFFGVLVSLACYEVGVLLRKKLKHPLCNPLLVSVILVILLLLAMDIPYADYNEGAKYLSYLLTPSTICLAIPLYERFALLRKNWAAILTGILSGVLASACCILAGAAVFALSHSEYVTLLPKSITTAIGIGLAEELGGFSTLTVAAIIITGILGNIIAETVCRLFRITEPIAVGVALGTSAHAIGTSKAIELGETEGAISSLSIAVAGVLTVLFSAVFSTLW